MKNQASNESASKWYRLYSLIRSADRGWRQTLLLGVPFLIILLWTIAASILVSRGFLEAGGFWPKWPTFSRIISWAVTIVPPFLVVAFGLSHLFHTADRFVFQLHEVDTESEAEVKERIRHRFWGWNGLSQTDYLVIHSTELRLPSQWSTWLGGPTLLIINDGFAAYLERGNSFSRVVGSGFPIPYLEARETIRMVVDLRPQVKEGRVNAWTNDGIKVLMKVRVEFQIDPDHAKISGKQKVIYPFDANAVRKAVEFTAVRFRDGKLEEVDWRDGAMGNITGRLSHHISSYHFDELFMRNGGNGQILSQARMSTLLEDANKFLRETAGVKVASIQVVEISVPAEIRQQRLNVWGAKKDSLVMRIEGEAQAYRIRTNEEARARAQRDMIVAIAKSLGKVDSAHFPDEPLLMSLSGILDQGLRDPLVQTYMARGTLDALQRLKDLL